MEPIWVYKELEIFFSVHLFPGISRSRSKTREAKPGCFGLASTNRQYPSSRTEAKRISAPQKAQVNLNIGEAGPDGLGHASI